MPFDMRRRLFSAFAAAAALIAVGAPVAAETGMTPDAALDARLEAARAADCSDANADRLTRIMCEGVIRVGLRDFYPLFSERVGDHREGYEVDVAAAIAAKLGVEMEQRRVNAATRIPSLAEDRIDLVLATMGHNTLRDTQVRFILPHYYQSETVFVGPKSLPIESWKDISGQAVCVTVGNLSNAQIASRGARLMLFDEAGILPPRLRDKNCTLAAQDDSFFAKYFKEPDFDERFSIKFGFSEVPWGMAVANTGSDDLAAAVDLIMQIFHRDGVLLDIARVHKVRPNFLQAQQVVWNRPDCNVDGAASNPSCVLPALHAVLEPTSFVGQVDAFEAWVAATAGWDISLPMLKTAPAWALFVKGMINSLILVAGALIATFVFALLLGKAMAARSIVFRWPARFLVVAVQSSPIVLTLVIAAAFTHAIFPYSNAVAIGAAIVALGLTNGGNAGQALSEAIVTVRQETGDASGVFLKALSRSATQIANFLINAAKGTPIAAFIGAPELLSTLTDITSFSSKRITTYLILLVFYTLIVVIVVWLCFKLRTYLERREAMA